MHRSMAFAAYGWLAFSGVLHFIVDVVSQHLRGRRAPGPETRLYYGLHSAFALGQVAFGLLGLVLARRALPLLSEPAVLLVSGVAALGWLAITFLFMPYWEPKFNAGVFCVLLAAAIAVRRPALARVQRDAFSRSAASEAGFVGDSALFCTAHARLAREPLAIWGVLRQVPV